MIGIAEQLNALETDLNGKLDDVITVDVMLINKKGGKSK